MTVTLDSVFLLHVSVVQVPACQNVYIIIILLAVDNYICVQIIPSESEQDVKLACKEPKVSWISEHTIAR